MPVVIIVYSVIFLVFLWSGWWLGGDISWDHGVHDYGVVFCVSHVLDDVMMLGYGCGFRCGTAASRSGFL